jgi:hypothetical protein
MHEQKELRHGSLLKHPDPVRPVPKRPLTQDRKGRKEKCRIWFEGHDVTFLSEFGVFSREFSFVLTKN